MFEDLDLTEIHEENARELIKRLLNLVEKQATDLRNSQAEIQRLRDEVNRLKGEQGKPNVKGNISKPPAANHSSEKERHTARPRHKSKKKTEIKIDREQVVEVDPSRLPPDAKFMGYEDVVVQDILLCSNNTLFHKQKYYSASNGKTYVAELPCGYEGQFGPGIKALSLVLYFGMGTSEPKILEFYENARIQISDGELSNLLLKNHEDFHAESAAVYEAGLRSSPWQHIDDTETRVNGQNEHCHVVCNPVYTSYHTRPHKDRLSVLDVLRQGRARMFRLNEEALDSLEQVALSKAAQQVLPGWCREQDLDEVAFQERLDSALPDLNLQQRTAILSATAVAAYHAETDHPIVQALVCDDAPQFKGLTHWLMLCWVHEGRAYKKLMPVVALHRNLQEEFCKRFWNYYDQLLNYRQNPTPQEAMRLEAEFDQLFTTRTEYAELDKQIARTHSKKESLLLVLKYPELPLHNNPAELGVRQRVRKRDVSFGPRTQDGRQAWDTFQTLAATTKKLQVSFYEYIQDRILKKNVIPPLSELIQQAARELNLGRSWSLAAPHY
jgi:hypothetical protein